MENSVTLDKLYFCCNNCYKACKNCNSPIFVSFRDVNIELRQKDYSVCYRFSLCPWCGFEYYDLESVWKKDLCETYNIDCDALEKADEWIEIPKEFSTDEWWIKREYFNFTKGYGGKKIIPIPKTYDHSYCCDTIYNLLDEKGDDSFRSYIKFIPNIRTYAILSKKKGVEFEPIDYCPFCGFKFPRRLDGELTKILQTEYGLESWEDYRKAPEEFHSDKWWKERNYDYNKGCSPL
jgi:hypothetical protein